jgi:hypothetical protein
MHRVVVVSAAASLDNSFLDLTLDAGAYWIQVDGYGGDSGARVLDVRVGDPQPCGRLLPSAR